MSTTNYASQIDKATQELRDRFRDSILGHQESFEELNDVWQECRVPDWDGYGALPVEQDTYRKAYLLIDSLPLGFPRPGIGAEPDGQLTLEWHKSPTRILSVSVDPDGLLHYAGIFGADRKNGTLTFFFSAPVELIQLVQKL
jgi:hypothetical protein